MKYIPLLLLLLLAGGCSTSSRLYRKVMKITPQEVAVAQQRPERGTIAPKPGSEKHPEPPVIGPEPAGEKPEEPAVTVISNVPMSFSALETEHVSTSAYNPFAGGDRLVFDLDELKADFHYPYPGNRISPYGMRGGRMHTGTDIKAIPNDTIRAAFSGVVRMSKLYSGYGNVVVVRHYNGLESVYSHNSKNLVKVGDAVKSGQPLSLAGRTGRATTEHLHFELRAKGRPFNPEYLIDCGNRTIRSGKLYLCYRNDGIVASNTDGSAAGSDTTVATPAPASAATPATSHTVARGDTLYAIARRYGTTVAKLCQLNGIPENKVLQIGEKIKVR